MKKTVIIVRLYYFIFCSFTIIMVTWSIFNRLSFVQAKDTNNNISLKIDSGDSKIIAYSNYFESYRNAGVDKRFLPEKLFDSIAQVKNQYKILIIFKILWLFSLIAVLIAVFTQARHGKYFVPLVGILSCVIWSFIMIIYLREHINRYSLNPLKLQSQPLYLSITLFLIFNYLFNLVIMFIPGFKNIFDKYYIFPYLLPLEQRSNYEYKLRNPSLNKGFLRSLTALIMVLSHIVLILIIALLIGNLIYRPIFNLQINNPGLSLSVLTILFLFIQVYYVFGYKKAFRDSINNSNTSGIKMLLLSISYLGYKFYYNILRILFYISIVVLFIVVLLLLILNNLSLLEFYKLLPVRKGL